MSQVAVVVDDHPMCRQATAMAIQAAAPALAIVEAGSLAEARVRAPHPALMTLDLALPDNHGILGLPDVRREWAGVPILVISGATNPDVAGQLSAMGIDGFLPKSARIGEIIDATRSLLGGSRWFSDLAEDVDNDSESARVASLTAAQARVLRAMEDGRLNKQIAYDLSLSEITVKAHVKAILKKLRVPNRTQAVLLLRRVEA